MKIGTAAREVGVHPITLKRLEKIGVIRPLRDRNGCRLFSPEDLQKARAYFYPLNEQENHIGKQKPRLAGQAGKADPRTGRKGNG
jgi:hypothetical protein